MPIYISGQRAKRGLWASIWEAIEEEWNRSKNWAKFTFFFRVAWSIFVLGLLLQDLRLIAFMMAVATLAVVSVGATIQALFITQEHLPVDSLPNYRLLVPLLVLWLIALSTWVYFKNKYPGKYAKIFNQNTEAAWVRQSPIWAGCLLTPCWIVLWSILRFIHLPTFTLGATLMYGVVILLLAWLISVLVREEKRKVFWENNKTDLTIIFFAIVIVTGLNILTYHLTSANRATWDWYFGNQRFFWAFNFGWIIVAWLASTKDEKGKGKTIPIAQFGATVITLALLSGFGYNLYYYRNPLSPRPFKTTVQMGITPSLGAMTTSDPEVALQIFADCESGDGTPGSGHQFLPGTTTPVRNPQDGKPGTGAVGRWQINLNDPAIKKLVEDHHWDVEGSEADNHAAAIFLYSQPPEQGGQTAPWTKSAKCWGPKVTTPGGVIVTLEAPTGETSSPYPIPTTGFKFRLVDSGKKYRAELVGIDDKGVPFTLNYFTGIAGPKQIVPGQVSTIGVQSLESERVFVQLILTPKT